MTQEVETMNPMAVDLNRGWKWVFALGVLSLILGFIGLGMEVGLTFVSMIFFSILLAVAGISHFAEAFQNKHWQGAIWQWLVGIFYLIAAGIVFYDPFLASTVITAFLAFSLIFIGISRLIMAFQMKGYTGWWWMIIAGLSALILGILILMHWPYSGLWVIGMFITIELIINGWTYIFVGLALRRAAKA
jgi:uncharacterized membrane protein HdeD (DUF308 family)